MTAPALSIAGLSKRFGGLVAVDAVSIDLAARRLNAIIGPNGAGKTTLFNLISGEIHADAGRVLFQGGDILGLKPHEVVRRGISRTLQIKSVFGGLSVIDNVRIAVLTHQRIMAPFRPVASFRAAVTRAEASFSATS